MKLKQYRCPNCNGIIEPNFEQARIICPHCNSWFLPSKFDKKKKKVKKESKNIKVEHHYTESKYIHTRHTDDAEVIKAQTEAFGTKVMVIFCIVLSSLFFIGIPFFFWIDDKNDEKKAESSKTIAIENGLIPVGSSSYSLIGQDYQAVQAHFESAGFKNIKLQKLNYEKLKFWTSGEVVSITIEGDSSFTRDDYFSPDSTVYISYH